MPEDRLTLSRDEARLVLDVLMEQAERADPFDEAGARARVQIKRRIRLFLAGIQDEEGPRSIADHLVANALAGGSPVRVIHLEKGEPPRHVDVDKDGVHPRPDLDAPRKEAAPAPDAHLESEYDDRTFTEDA